MTQRPFLIHHFLEESALRFPESLALVHDGVRVTYDEVNNKANLLARFLLERGLKAGDRVAILLENCLEYVVSYYGTLKTGAVAVPLSTDLKPDALNTILAEFQPKWVISGARFEKLLHAADLNESFVQGLLLKIPKLSWSGKKLEIVAFENLLVGNAADNPNIHIPSNDLASIIYTSGSTGRVKGVMLSHHNIVFNTLAICQYLRLTHADIQMVVLPFFYVMGKSLLNTHFAVGGTVVINNKFAFPATVLNEMVSENVTGFSGVPSTYAYLLHRSPLAGFRDKLTSLRYCSQAGGHMARVVKEDLRRVLPEHTQIYIMYGATEASARLSYLEPERYLDKMDSIGKAIPGVELRVLDRQGKEMAPGQIGELTAMGPNIMQGYWCDPEATVKVLDGCGYHTGDQAYRDEEGYFYIVGRKDDLIKVGGHRINTREIEDVLMESGMCVEAAVLGLPDELLGHRLVAFTVPRTSDCDENQILACCAAKVAKYKVPSKTVQMRSLPKSTSGKIDRGKCLEFLKRNSM